MGRTEVAVDVLQQYRYQAVDIKTGASYDKWVKQTFIYCPPWVYLLMIGGLLPLLIVYLIVRKQVIIHLPASKGAQTKRNLMTTAGVICLLTGAGFLFAMISDPKWGIVSAALIGLTIYIGTAGMDRVWIRGRLSKDASTIGISGAHPHFISQVMNPTEASAPEAPAAQAGPSPDA